MAVDNNGSFVLNKPGDSKIQTTEIFNFLSAKVLSYHDLFRK